MNPEHAMTLLSSLIFVALGTYIAHLVWSRGDKKPPSGPIRVFGRKRGGPCADLMTFVDSHPYCSISGIISTFGPPIEIDYDCDGSRRYIYHRSLTPSGRNKEEMWRHDIHLEVSRDGHVIGSGGSSWRTDDTELAPPRPAPKHGAWNIQISTSFINRDNQPHGVMHSEPSVVHYYRFCPTCGWEETEGDLCPRCFLVFPQVPKPDPPTRMPKPMVITHCTLN